MSQQGTPVWYELSTSNVDAAQRFYEKVIGWKIADSGMAGLDYRLANVNGAMVAGMMVPPMEGVPPWWAIYFAVDNCDKTAAALTAAGGKVHVPPTDIPGVGRFAIVTDPQGAAFGLLTPLPMDTPQPPAFDQKKMGHGNWHELMSTDPKAGLDFYRKLFGWTASTAMDMGDMGTYQIFAHQGQDIGGMMGLGNAPVSCWIPYFGVDGIDAAITRITANGGTKLNGPMEVPGGAFIVVAADPQGAHFALVGPK